MVRLVRPFNPRSAFSTLSQTAVLLFGILQLDWNQAKILGLRALFIRNYRRSYQQRRRRELKQFSRTLTVGVMLLGLTLMAKSKQYEVVITHPVQAGAVQLKEGTYQLELEGTMATLFQGKKEIGKIPVRSDEVPKKIEVTSVGVVGDKLTSIQLGGTKTRLVLSGAE